MDIRRLKAFASSLLWGHFSLKTTGWELLCPVLSSRPRCQTTFQSLGEGWSRTFRSSSVMAKRMKMVVYCRFFVVFFLFFFCVFFLIVVGVSSFFLCCFRVFVGPKHG